ncbi:hypothetical protein [Belliella aquatica]|uniref:Uncharacterized protein n=1 Tax=Belliella aquatica TaxID=1323734 RepID=A0ABQ1M9A2_9BACT|nr:hypothetical protein [Belliella aquatica]MCH7404630.1 hypothetical protein [Belliella aquatica]GGC35375.1 hypothetical protein GCM10010993_12870 [Belliella aquatica]
MENNVEKYKAEQEERIQRSKIYGDGTTPIPHGILEILFIDSETGKITKHTGKEQTSGRILILLPFRTPRNLSKYAAYTQPSEWKLKFNRGMMVNTVIEDGYIKKLIPSYKFMPASQVIDPASFEVPNELLEKISEVFNEIDHSVQEVPVGFENLDKVPF